MDHNVIHILPYKPCRWSRNPIVHNLKDFVQERSGSVICVATARNHGSNGDDGFRKDSQRADRARCEVGEDAHVQLDGREGESPGALHEEREGHGIVEFLNV